MNISRMYSNDSLDHTLNSTNTTDVFDDKFPFNQIIVAIVVPIVFGFILIAGIVGNGSVIVIVIKNVAMRTMPNVYILSLALGDLILIIVSVPFSAFIYTFESWHFGQFICKFNEYMQTLSVGVSVFTLALLSLDRYKAITEPMETQTERTLTKTVARVCAVWVVSAVLAIPDAIMTDVYRVVDNSTGDPIHYTFCEQFHEKSVWYRKFQVLFRFVVYFAVPIVVITFCYVLMGRTLFRGDVYGAMRNVRPVCERRRDRMKVARLVLSFVVVFVVCWLPRHVYMLWSHLANDDFSLFWYIFKITGFCLMFINSCMNPIALYLQSQLFRKCFRKQFVCRDEAVKAQYMHMRQINGSKPPTASTVCF